MACEISTLVTEGESFKNIDDIDAQALRTYLLALMLHELTGENVDICALAEEMKQYNYLSDGDLRTAELSAMVRLATASGVDNVTEAQARTAIACSHCCTITPRAMWMAEINLWCRVAAEMRQT